MARICGGNRAGGGVNSDARFYGVHRAAEIHLGISWLVGGLACGVFMLAFPTLGPPGWRLRGGWR